MTIGLPSNLLAPAVRTTQLVDVVRQARSPVSPEAPSNTAEIPKPARTTPEIVKAVREDQTRDGNAPLIKQSGTNRIDIRV